MKFDISKTRKSLEKNKIFFEIIVASLLSFMSIYVSWQSYKIAEAQTKIMKEENLPQIEIRKTYDVYNDSLKIYDNKFWLFFNRGGRISNFDIQEFSFYEFAFKKDSKVGNFDTLSLPIYDYINTRGTLTGESEGLIYQFDNYHNGAKEMELKRGLINLGYYDINTYILITYRDIFNESHEDYFQISPNIKNISRQKWDEIQNEFVYSKERYDFSNILAEQQ